MPQLALPSIVQYCADGPDPVTGVFDENQTYPPNAQFFAEPPVSIRDSIAPENSPALLRLVLN